MIDLGVHIIDLGMYLMGKPQPVSVFGSTNSSIGNRANVKGISWYKAADYDANRNEVKDFANALIKFENGATLCFETSWVMHIKSNTVYTELFGDKGGAKLEPDLEIFSERSNYLVDSKPILSSSSFDFEEAFPAEINHFVDCIMKGDPCIYPAENGTRIMKIIEAVYESAKTGNTVKLA